MYTICAYVGCGMMMKTYGLHAHEVIAVGAIKQHNNIAYRNGALTIYICGCWNDDKYEHKQIVRWYSRQKQ